MQVVDGRAVQSRGGVVIGRKLQWRGNNIFFVMLKIVVTIACQSGVDFVGESGLNDVQNQTSVGEQHKNAPGQRRHCTTRVYILSANEKHVLLPRPPRELHETGRGQRRHCTTRI